MGRGAIFANYDDAQAGGKLNEARQFPGSAFQQNVAKVFAVSLFAPRTFFSMARTLFASFLQFPDCRYRFCTIPCVKVGPASGGNAPAFGFRKSNAFMLSCMPLHFFFAFLVALLCFLVTFFPCCLFVLMALRVVLLSTCRDTRHSHVTMYTVGAARPRRTGGCSKPIQNDGGNKTSNNEIVNAKGGQVRRYPFDVRTAYTVRKHEGIREVGGTGRSRSDCAAS